MKNYLWIILALVAGYALHAYGDRFKINEVHNVDGYRINVLCDTVTHREYLQAVGSHGHNLEYAGRSCQ